MLAAAGAIDFALFYHLFVEVDAVAACGANNFVKVAVAAIAVTVVTIAVAIITIALVVIIVFFVVNDLFKNIEVSGLKRPRGSPRSPKGGR